ncbi:hypothetical protein [Mycolicibacterium fortuitum]|uniref:hypothetical protein n=1 Tax=Mycolicibacterium fortuitum TaxID=1766 RepID=UPI00148F590B|nr:hypothetical protein [Mycolicibacterium fortuitum]
MNTKKYIAPVGVAALAVATMLTTACGTPTETNAASSSTSAASNNSAVRELRLARAEEGKRELRLSVAAAIPHTVDREYAAAAASDAVPFIFSYGGCAWMRMPDKSLYNLHGAGGSLTRDTAAEKEFGSWPGAGEPRVCEPATGIPDADDPSVTTPYRWIYHGRVAIRVNGKHHELPDQIPESGEVLGGPTTPTN